MDDHTLRETQAKEGRRLSAGFLLLVGLLIFEIIGGIRSGSLALLGDAGHVLMDTVALGASFAVAALLFAGALRLVRRAGRILLEGTELDTNDLARAIWAIPGVESARHLHVRTLTDGVVTLTARVHPVGNPRLSECAPILRAIETMLREHYNIRHVTIQFEIPRADQAVECALDPPAPQ